MRREGLTVGGQSLSDAFEINALWRKARQKRMSQKGQRIGNFLWEKDLYKRTAGESAESYFGHLSLDPTGLQSCNSFLCCCWTIKVHKAVS